MVTITDYKKATNAEGNDYFMLVVQGGVESVLSKESGRFYLTARKAIISTTFDEETCKSLIQTKIPGGIEKVQVDPYTYTIEDTGEEVTLEHSWQYNPNIQSMEEAVFGDALEALKS